MTEQQVIERIQSAIAKITQPRQDGIGVMWTNRGAAIQAWNELQRLADEGQIKLVVDD